MKVGMLEEEEEEEEEEDVEQFDPEEANVDDFDRSYAELIPFKPKMKSQRHRNYSIRQSVRNARASYVSHHKKSVAPMRNIATDKTSVLYPEDEYKGDVSITSDRTRHQ